MSSTRGGGGGWGASHPITTILLNPAFHLHTSGECSTGNYNPDQKSAGHLTECQLVTRYFEVESHIFNGRIVGLLCMNQYQCCVGGGEEEVARKTIRYQKYKVSQDFWLRILGQKWLAFYLTGDKKRWNYKSWHTGGEVHIPQGFANSACKAGAGRVACPENISECPRNNTAQWNHPDPNL